MSHFRPYTFGDERVERDVADMRAAVLAWAAQAKADQQPLAKARRAKAHAEFMAELDAQMARVAELDRAYAAKYLTPAVEIAA